MNQTPSASSTASNPATLCGYGISQVLSSGRTYLVRADDGRMLVLKRLDADCLLEGELHPLIHDRLARVRELAHMGVANLLGVQRDGDDAFLVWEFVPGLTLQRYLRDADPDPQRLRTIARSLRGSIESLHALGIIHGAVHERNIIVRPDGSVCLTHISPLLYQDPQADLASAARVLGAMGQGLDQRADSTAAAESIGERRANVSMLATSARPRWSAITGAILASALGAAIAWGIWSYAHRGDAQQIPPEPPTIAPEAAP